MFDDSCCAWSSSDENDLDLVLKHVTLGIPKGSFVAVIGEVSYVRKDWNMLVSISYLISAILDAEQSF